MKFRICFVALCLLVFYRSAAHGQTAEWEYKQLGAPSDELLNHYAKNGWEVATAAGGQRDNGSFYHYVVLKRGRSHPLFGTKTPEMPKPAPQPSTCKLTLAQAPVVRGFRLGMTNDELFAVFPGNERQELDRAQQLKSAEAAPNYGLTIFQFFVSDYPTRDQFTGVGSFGFGVLDGKVVSIGVQYEKAPQFDNQEQLMEIITRQFGLPAFQEWPGYRQYWNNPSLTCEGFTFQVHGFSGRFLIELADPAYKKIVEERKKSDLAKKRAGFKL